MKSFYKIVLSLTLSSFIYAGSPDAVVVFNEIHYNPRGVMEEGEWIEVFNQMGIMTDLSGWQIKGVGYTFPAGTFIDPGETLVVYKTPPPGELGPFSGSLDNGGERLELINQGDRLMDELDYGDKGRWPVEADGSGATLAKRRPYTANKPVEHWTYSEQLGGTPGKPNFPDADTPPATTTTPIFGLNQVWRYNQAGDELGTNWAASAHAVGGSWSSGAGVLASENGLSETINTTLSFPPFNSPYVVTYYFETEFNLGAGQVASLESLRLRYLVDDGAVFYLNGTEVLRVNMPGGIITSTNFANNNIEAELSTTTLIPPGAAVAGSNRLSVEVHQAFSGSSDVVLGAELDIVTLDPVFGAAPPLRINELPDASSTNYWVELINAGSGPIEMGGFSLSAGGDPGRTYLLPTQTLNVAEILLIDEATLGFRPADDENIFLYDAAQAQVLDGQQQTGRLRGRSAEHKGAWLFPDSPTPGSPNLFTFDDRMVISEIAYNPPNGVNTGGQWLELANRSGGTVDLGGWDFGDGINFVFPTNTLLASGEHACIADDALAFANAFPTARLLGEFNGDLSRNGERLLLRDAQNNPVDEIRYFDSGRWPKTTDGRAATLELRDLNADNAVAESWAASDETGQTAWATYSYSGTAAASRGPDTKWSEFNMGLVSAGEILIDDIHVVENGSTEKISNTDFSSGATAWRFRGTHRHSEIVDDPDSPGNKVLRLVASGPTEHMHNQVETTLLSTVNNGQNYTISYRARWVHGANLLHTRLYFNRLPMMTAIDRPERVGTPSAPNSQAEANIGPSITETVHAPAVPGVDEPMVVSARVADPDNVTTVQLFYSVDEGAFQNIPMGAGADGVYEASVPGQSAATIVQFYVQAMDGLGAVSTFPAAGPDSRALVKVDDGLAASNGQHNFRILMLPSETAFMHQSIEVMSNDRLGTTVIDRENDIYYDVGMRLKSSERGRNSQLRVGFNLRFGSDQPYRGIHQSVAIDRSDASTQQNSEILFDIMIANSGGVISRYYDFIKVLAPQDRHTRSAVLQMARYDDVFLDSQFENGSDGNIYEYELIYAPNTANANGYKLPNPDGVNGVHVGNLGDSKELYRWFYLKKNNRADDEFSDIIAYNKKFSQNGAAFEDGLEDVVDIDAWFRGMAYAVLSGAGDNAAAGGQHNGVLYARPDGRVIFFPHDMDFSFSTSRSITANRQVDKLTDDPVRERTYLGHLHDIISTTYNTAYMSMWADHLDTLDPVQTWETRMTHITSRSANVLGQINNAVAPITFDITSPNPLSVNGSTATLTGDGWVNVREIRLAGGGAVPVVWTDDNSWQVELPVFPGANTVSLEAINFSGDVIRTETITVNNTSTIEPASSNNLVISEFMYHPSPPTTNDVTAGFADEDLFEFIELMNVGSLDVNLAGAGFTGGIVHALPAVILASGERVVLARDRDAFLSRHPGAAASLLPGEYYGLGDTNQLSNSGEELGLQDASGADIQRFTYEEDLPWPSSADGDGFSLVLMAPGSLPDHTLATNWRSSGFTGGTPGGSEATTFAGDPNADDDGDGLNNLVDYALGDTSAPQLVREGEDVVLRFHRNLLAEDVILTVEASNDLEQWDTNGLQRIEARSLGNGLEIQRWVVDGTTAIRRYLRLTARQR